MNLFKRNLTKWIPLGNYQFDSGDYIVFVRKNLKTGMMTFKVKKVQGFLYSDYFLPLGLIDVKKQWEIITETK